MPETEQQNLVPKALSEKSDAELKREAKARFRHMSPVAASEVVEEVMGSPVVAPVIGFVDFLREKAVVGLAVGFVVGSQVQVVTSTFINSVINPMIELTFSTNQKLSDRQIYVQFGDHHSTTFFWGKVAYAMLDFFFVLVVLYILIKLFKLDKLDKKKL